MIKVLIIHGWLHSTAMYMKLKEDLESMFYCEVDLYELPGFGGNKPVYNTRLLKHYSEAVPSNKYDYVIGHSMGGNIALRINDVKAKLILLSPVYRGISLLKPLSLIVPAGLFFLQRSKCRIMSYLLKVFTLLTINKWSLIDEGVLRSIRSASTSVAIVSMFEMTWDTWHASDCRDVYLIVGDKDRVISQRKMKLLQKDLRNCELYVLQGIGHTAVIEAYDELLNVICHIISKEVL